MSGNLTIDRSLGYTATELNDYFDDWIAAFNGVLPSGIAIQNGNSFANLSLEELDSISAGINTPNDILAAISYLGENLASGGSSSVDDNLSNSSWTIGTLPIDSPATTRAKVLSVQDKGDSSDSSTFSTIGEKYVANGLEDNPQNLQNFYNTATNKGSVLSALTEAERYTQTSSLWQQSTYPTSITSTWNQAAYLQTETIATKNFAQFGSAIAKSYTQGQVQPLSNSSGTTWQQVSFTEEEVDSGLSDNYTLPLSTKETFEEIGFNDWVVTTSALLTNTIETFDSDTGIENGVVSWFQNDPTRFTFESFSNGFDLGKYPTRICSGGSSGSLNEITEDISSQINGSTQIFTLTNSYVSGSLRVYWNGQRQIVGETITELSSTTFSTSFIPLVGQYLNVDYVKQS